MALPALGALPEQMMHCKLFPFLIAGIVLSASLSAEAARPARTYRTDAGVVLDAGSTADAGILDAGTPDAGTVLDAGSPSTPPPTGRWVSGYYAGYQSKLQAPENIDYSGLTHVIMARLIPNSNGTLNITFDINTTEGPALARKISTLAHQAGKKAILMVGGAGTVNGFVGATSNTYRATFVANLLKAVQDYGYDGLDIDWEPISSANEPYLLALVQDLRLASPNLYITIPVSWAPANEKFFGTYSALFDQINIMSYGMADQYGGWNTWHSSALQNEVPAGPSSVNKSANMYIAAGVPAAKLGAGIGAYGSCWNGNATGPNQPTTGRVVAGDNAMSFTNIMTLYYSTGNFRYDSSAQAPYLGSTTPIGPNACSFISYENATSIIAKGNYVKNKGMGGAIMWTIQEQYMPNAVDKNPLLTATKQGFLQ